jgi:hypothetical protein
VDPVQPPDDPPPPDRLRWLGRGVVAAIGLWFVLDGLSARWSGASVLAVVVAVAGVALAIAFGVVLVRQQRAGRDGPG